MSNPTAPAVAGPALAADLTRFFADYAAAYDAFDATAIADRFAVPSYILHSDRAAAAFTARETLVANMERVNDLNRAHDYGRAETGALAITAFAPTLAQVTVPWTIRTRAGAILWQFTCTYNLAKGADGWKILVCTNHAPDA
jgi:hypothetical protein